MSDLRRALVVYKKSLYQLYVEEHREPSVKAAFAADDPATRRMLKSHDRQVRAMEKVAMTLEKAGVATEARWRGRIRSVAGYDIVIAVGGDGTVLDTSRWLSDRTPLLGINSDPRASVGKLCAGVSGDLPKLLDAIASGWKPERLTRLRIRSQGQDLLGPCLNDVLFANRSPAEMSRFDFTQINSSKIDTLSVKSRGVTWTPIRSSGVWISTATGATAAIRSAGGRPMTPGSRRLQYVIRERYRRDDDPPGVRSQSFVKSDEAIGLVNRMRVARIWADGAHRQATLSYGQIITIDNGAARLSLYRRAYRGDQDAASRATR